MQNNGWINVTARIHGDAFSLPMATTLEKLDPNAQLFAAAVIAGCTTHLGYFIRQEHHNTTMAIIKSYLVLDVVIAALFLRANAGDWAMGVIKTAIVTGAYLLGLFGSMGIYRAYIHPLRKFRGPFWARLSNLYHSSLLWKNSDNYRLIYQMHQKYGPIVRTGMWEESLNLAWERQQANLYSIPGPANLSLNIPEAVQRVYGADSPCEKSPWYDTSLPLQNLHTTRDRKVHERRRKVWARAFAPKALTEYDDRIAEYSERFCQHVVSLKGKPFDATRWFKYYAWDVMGELGFGESFHMLEDEKNRWVPDLLEEGMSDIAQMQVVPWASILLHRLPLIAKGPKQFASFIIEQALRRAKQIPTKPDVLRYLVEDYERSAKQDADFQWFRGDTRLFVVGGSDTTAATLTHIMYYLATYPEQLRKLRDEIEPLLQGRTTLDPKDVMAAQHLNGIIHETLRLHPPIPSGFPRLTPKEGLVINGTYIPGNTTVVVPLWAMGRCK